MKIKTIKINICEACLKGEGQECHTPGCALFLHEVDLPIREELYEVIQEYESEEIEKTKSNFIKIGTTSGLRGRFAVMYDDEGPIETGLTCKTFKEVKQYAISWTKAEFGDEWKEHCDFKEEEKNELDKK